MQGWLQSRTKGRVRKLGRHQLFQRVRGRDGGGNQVSHRRSSCRDSVLMRGYTHDTRGTRQPFVVPPFLHLTAALPKPEAQAAMEESRKKQTPGHRANALCGCQDLWGDAVGVPPVCTHPVRWVGFWCSLGGQGEDLV